MASNDHENEIDGKRNEIYFVCISASVFRRKSLTKFSNFIDDSKQIIAHRSVKSVTKTISYDLQMIPPSHVLNSVNVSVTCVY